jgi:phage tail-like protein
VSKQSEEPTFLLLDKRLGWRTADSRNISAGGALRLAADPAGPLSFGWPDDSLGGLILPRGMALDESGTLYMLQLHAPWHILRFDPGSRAFAPLEGVGGAGSDARRVRDPRTIAIGGGYLYVADTGNRRVQVFARASLALLHLFALPAWQPVDVAVEGGGAYILDARGGRVYRHRAGADELEELVLAVPRNAPRRWRRIAVDQQGLLYLLDQPAAGVDIYDTTGQFLDRVTDAGAVRERFAAPPLQLVYKTRQDTLESGRFCLPESLARECDRAQPAAPAAPAGPGARCDPWATPLGAPGPRLRPGDLRDPAGLLLRLCRGQDALTRYLREQLAPDTRQRLAQYTATAPPDMDLQIAVLRELNHLLESTPLYTQARFSGIALRPETRALVGQNPQGARLARLNRQLLEEAFPREIRKSGAGLAGGLVFDREGRRAVIRPDEPAGAALYNPAGTWISGPLDSAIYHCQWHRIVLDLATLPPGGQVIVSTYSAAKGSGWPDAGSDLWQQAYTIAGQMQPPPGSVTAPQRPAPSEEEPHEFLVPSHEGQYLWLKIELAGGGYGSPEVRAIRVHYPRRSYLAHLPAVYAADDESRWFLERFLSVFQTEWDAIEQRIAGIARYFDPDGAPGTGGWLEMLAGWLGLPLEQTWNADQKRHVLQTAARFYLKRGTAQGLRSYLQAYLWNMTALDQQQQGDYPLLLEGFRERHWLLLAGATGAPLWGPAKVGRLQLDVFSRADEARLVSTGAPARDVFYQYAHRFKVVVPAAWVRTAADERLLRRALAIEMPAHTAYDLYLIEPRFRVGVQSTVGVDTIVGAYPAAQLACPDEDADAPPSRPPRHGLGYDTLLTTGNAPRAPEPLVSAGINTILR